MDPLSIGRFIPFKAQYLSENPAVLTNDQHIKKCLIDTTRLMESYLGATLYQRVALHSEFFNGDGTNQYQLMRCSAEIPMVNITLTITRIMLDGSQEVVDPTYYRVLGNGIIILLEGRKWVIGDYNYKFEYHPGWFCDYWETSDYGDSSWAIPDDLERACWIHAAHLYKQSFGTKGDARHGLKSVSTEDASLVFIDITKNFYPEVEGILQPYILKRIC